MKNFFVLLTIMFLLGSAHYVHAQGDDTLPGNDSNKELPGKAAFIDYDVYATKDIKLTASHSKNESGDYVIATVEDRGVEKRRLRIVMHTALGKQVAGQAFNTEPGKAVKIDIGTTKLPQGKYTIGIEQINDDKTLVTKKITIKKP